MQPRNCGLKQDQLNTTLRKFLFFTSWSMQVAYGNSVTFDKTAERKCMEYKKVCPRDKRCGIQIIHWPMNMSFPVCVPKKYFPVKMRVCELPPEPGNCGARFMRWYYNRHSQKCTLFKYQGCNGNMNNFKSRAECQASCYSQNSLQNDAHTGYDPRAFAEARLQYVPEPVYVSGRTKQHPGRVRNPRKSEKDKRRKRRLKRQKRKRLNKLRRLRKKGLKSKKRRREGKIIRDRKGRKNKHHKRNKKNKKRKNKKRKNKKKNKKNKKNQKRKELFEITEGGTDFNSNEILITSTLIPEVKNLIPQTKTEKEKPSMTLFSILDPKKPTVPTVVER